MPRIFEAPPGFVLNPDYLVPDLEAQRDALLEALKKIAAIGNKMWGTDWEEIEEARGIARAAIKAVEGEKT